MSRETRIVCDKCNCEIRQNERYFTLRINEYKSLTGKKQIYPTLWLCKKCYAKTGLSFPTTESEEKRWENK